MIECANIPCESEKIDWNNIKKIGMKGWWGKTRSNNPWRPLQHQITIVMPITFLRLMKMWGLISLIMLKKLHLAKILNPKLEAHKKKLILKVSIKST